MKQIRSPRRTAGQWQSLIEQWQHGGKSAKAFCQERGLGYASFCNWRRRLSLNEARAWHPESTPDGQPAFIDLTDLGSRDRSGRWHITLSLGNGVELRLSQA